MSQVDYVSYRCPAVPSADPDTWRNVFVCVVQNDTKKRELLKTPTKIKEIQEKKIIDRNWTITTCLLRDSNPNYQCLKITSCRWRPPPHMHSFTAITHFKSSRSFVSPCVCCMICRMRLCRILPLRISKVPVLLCYPVCVACSAECDSVAFCRACNKHRVTQKNGNFWNA